MDLTENTTLCTLKIQDGRRNLSSPEARHLYNRRIARSVRLNNGRRLAFAIMSNHTHEVLVSIKHPVLLPPHEALERFGCYYDHDENDPNFRRILPQLQHYGAGGPAPTCVKALGPLPHILKRADEWTAMDRRREIKRRERHNQRGHFWGSPVHKSTLEDVIALRRAIAYVDMNPAAAGLEEVPGEKPLTGFHEALAGNSVFQQNYMDLYGTDTFEEAAKRHSITLTQLGMRTQQGKVMLSPRALHCLATTPSSRVLDTSTRATAQHKDFAHHDLVSVLSRSGRIWSEDHLRVQVAADPTYDAGKRAHIPTAGLVGAIRTRRCHPDDFNPYEPIATIVPLPPAPDDNTPSSSMFQHPTSNSSEPVHKPFGRKPSTSRPEASDPKPKRLGKHFAPMVPVPSAPPMHLDPIPTAKIQPSQITEPPPPIPAQYQATADDYSFTGRGFSTCTPIEPKAPPSSAAEEARPLPGDTSPDSPKSPWLPPERPPRLKLTAPPAWHFIASKVHDTAHACVKHPPRAPRPGPRATISIIPAHAIPPMAAAFQTPTDLRAAYPPAA